MNFNRMQGKVTVVILFRLRKIRVNGVVRFRPSDMGWIIARLDIIEKGIFIHF